MLTSSNETWGAPDEGFKGWRKPTEDAGMFMARVAKRSQFFKTRMCPWLIGGLCSYGKSCAYAHTREELRSPPDLSNTRMCVHVLQGGKCTVEGCRFAHTPRELRATDAFKKTRICPLWTVGTCISGSNCRLAHGTEELRRNPIFSRTAKVTDDGDEITGASTNQHIARCSISSKGSAPEVDGCSKGKSNRRKHKKHKRPSVDKLKNLDTTTAVNHNQGIDDASQFLVNAATILLNHFCMHQPIENQFATQFKQFNLPRVNEEQISNYAPSYTPYLSNSNSSFSNHPDYTASSLVDSVTSFALSGCNRQIDTGDLGYSPGSPGILPSFPLINQNRTYCMPSPSALQSELRNTGTYGDPEEMERIPSNMLISHMLQNAEDHKDVFQFSKWNLGPTTLESPVVDPLTFCRGYTDDSVERPYTIVT